jgi:hypothetical protein
MGVRGPLDVGMSMWHGYRLHQIDRALPEPAAEDFQACAKQGVGRYNLDAYTLHRSGNRHYYEEGWLESEELRVDLVDARLYKVRTRQSTEVYAHTKSWIRSCRTDVRFDTVFVVAVLPLLTCFVTEYHPTLQCRNWRGM